MYNLRVNYGFFILTFDIYSIVICNLFFINKKMKVILNYKLLGVTSITSMRSLNGIII